MMRLGLWCLLGTLYLAVANADSAIFWVSGPVDSNGAVLVTGHFPNYRGIQIKAADLTDTTGDWRSMVTKKGINVIPLRATEHNLVFALSGLGEGVQGFRLDQKGEEPQFARINLPEIWWTMSEPQTSPDLIGSPIQMNTITPGEVMNIFGRCLLRTVTLTSESGAKLPLKVINANPYALSVEIPADLIPGRYSLFAAAGIHNESTSSAPLVVDVRPRKNVRFTRIDAGNFGAIGDGKFDNSAVFAAALANASRTGPAIVTIPSGSYFFQRPLLLPPGIYLRGRSPSETALEFPNIDPAPQAWIAGSYDFGLANLSVYCGNHKGIISSEMSGKPEQSGHVRLQNVRVRGNAFSGQFGAGILKPQWAGALTTKLMQSASGYETIRLSGPDLRVEDCDVLGTSRALYIHNARGVIIRRNKLFNGLGGWYNIDGSEGVIVANNLIEGSDLLAVGGSYSAGGSHKSSLNIYTAENTYARLQANYGEAFTSDGGGGAYFGAIANVNGTALTLKDVPQWGTDDWQGALVAITSGRGLGQWRILKSWSGRNIELSRSLDITPDATSTLTIVPLQLHYVFYQNHVSDAGVAIQFYGSGVEHIAANNVSTQAGGFNVIALQYGPGVQPEINIQLLNNSISGFSYGYQAEHGLATIPSALEARVSSPSVIIGLVLRNNDFRDNSVLRIKSWGRAGLKGILLDGNHHKVLLEDKTIPSDLFIR